MPIFDYKARTQGGEMRTGVIETSSQDTALDALQKNGLIVVSVGERGKKSLFEMQFGRGVRQRDIVLFSRQMATLFEAQIPVIQILRTLSSQAIKPRLRKIVNEVMADVTGGMALSQAFGKHPEVFSSFYVSLIRAGEESGKLQDVFTYLADYLERSYYIANKARNALIYPAFILLAFIGVFTIMLTVVIPKLTSIFKETGTEVPFYTQIIISLSDLLRNYGLFFLLGLIGGIIFLWRWGRTPAGKRFFNTLQIRVPIIGGLYQRIFIVRMTDNMRTLMVSGIPLIRALTITEDVVGNVVYQDAVVRAIAAVKAGSTISSAFEQTPEIPVMVTQMIKIGEESGRLDFILENISRFYQKEVDSLVDNLLTLIEPILILVLGGGVAVLVAAILIPIYNIAGGV